MKYMFASDIHGSAYWCGRLLQAFEREKADRLVLLGDELYHGPRNPLPDGYAPKEVYEMLNGIADKIIAVRGNCDSEVDQMVLDFPIMADYAMLELGGVSVMATHGHLFSDDGIPRGAKIVISGHTHLVRNEYCCGVLRLNPGSVSLPKENSARGYIVCENGVFTFRTLDGEKYDETPCLLRES